MPLTTWTERDELLSDALHMRDVAMGLADPNPLWVEDALAYDEDDDAFGQHFKDERGFESHGAFERAVETWTRRNEPVLTSDAKAHPHDAEHVPTIRWRDGAACGVYIDLERESEAHVTVEPRAVETDLLIEPVRQVAEEEEGEFPTLSTPTVPTPERCRAYTVAMLATGRGSISSTTTIEGVGTFPTRAVYKSVKADVARLAEKRRRRAGRYAREQGERKSTVQATSTAQARVQKAREARRDLMPMQWDVTHQGNSVVPDAVASRICASLRLWAYQAGRYVPTGGRQRGFTPSRVWAQARLAANRS